MRPLAACLLSVVLAAGTVAEARLGDSLKAITERYGRPTSQPNKVTAMWLFEEGGGQVIYTVTFNARGASIAEGFKPRRNAVLTTRTAETFIRDQLLVRSDARGGREVPAGEKFVFGGKEFTAGENEYVFVDDAADLLVVWQRTYPASIIVLSHEMVAGM